MTLQDLITFFHTDNYAKLGRLLGVHRATIHYWEKQGISYFRQLDIEKLTGGGLKAVKDE